LLACNVSTCSQHNCDGLSMLYKHELTPSFLWIIHCATVPSTLHIAHCNAHHALNMVLVWCLLLNLKRKSSRPLHTWTPSKECSGGAAWKCNSISKNRNIACWTYHWTAGSQKTPTGEQNWKYCAVVLRDERWLWHQLWEFGAACCVCWFYYFPSTRLVVWCSFLCSHSISMGCLLLCCEIIDVFCCLVALSFLCKLRGERTQHHRADFCPLR